MNTFLLFLTIVAWPIAVLSTLVLGAAIWVYVTSIKPTHINDAAFYIRAMRFPSLISNAWLLTYYLT